MLYPAELRARGPKWAGRDIGGRSEARNPLSACPATPRCTVRRAALHRPTMRHFAPLLALGLSACAATSTTEPSLARRPAEAIDPRLPVPVAAPTGPADPALASRLAELLAQGNEGARAFDSLTAQAEALANAAGPRESESWIVAQQALSGLEGARAKSTASLSEIDAIASARIQSGAGLKPADLAAIEAASAELRATTDRQSAIIDRLGARLSR